MISARPKQGFWQGLSGFGQTDIVPHTGHRSPPVENDVSFSDSIPTIVLRWWGMILRAGERCPLGFLGGEQCPVGKDVLEQRIRGPEQSANPPPQLQVRSGKVSVSTVFHKRVVWAAERQTRGRKPAGIRWNLLRVNGRRAGRASDGPLTAARGPPTTVRTCTALCCASRLGRAPISAAASPTAAETPAQGWLGLIR